MIWIDLFQVIAAEGEQKASRALREAAETIADSHSALQVWDWGQGWFESSSSGSSPSAQSAVLPQINHERGRSWQKPLSTLPLSLIGINFLSLMARTRAQSNSRALIRCFFGRPKLYFSPQLELFRWRRRPNFKVPFDRAWLFSGFLK